MSLGAASLPARERGLKREETIHLPGIQVSLPARERGLKPSGIRTAIKMYTASLPARERGLKPIHSQSW